ncbi:hypothetical protein Tco_0589068 [Tanacetum coccineum]
MRAAFSSKLNGQLVVTFQKCVFEIEVTVSLSGGGNDGSSLRKLIQEEEYPNLVICKSHQLPVKYGIILQSESEASTSSRRKSLYPRMGVERVRRRGRNDPRVPNKEWDCH